MKKKLNITLLDLYNFLKKYPEYKNKILVQTRFGYYPIEDCAITAYNSNVISITTESGKTLKGSPDHLLFDQTYNWKKIKNLTIDDKLFTYDGLEKIISIKLLKHKKNLYDIQVAEKHEFYANGIVSHNSQLFESLCFSLYGQTRNNIKNGNIHNKYIPGKETRVVTYFSIEKHNYKVASGFNKHGVPYCELYEIIDNNEVNITKSTIAETRKFLENEILHCDISIFLRTILLSSDQNYNFFRLRKGEKKEFIEKLFDISVFGDMYNVIHRDILNNDKEILALQNKLIVLNKSHDEYKNRIEKYNLDNAKNIDNLNLKLTTFNNKLEELKQLKIKNNSDEVKKYEDAIDKITTASDELNKKIRLLKDENSKIELIIHKLNSNKDQKQKVVDKHSELLSKLCNDCKKIFSEYHNINTYMQDILQYTENISLNTKKLETNILSIEKINEKLNILNEKKNNANNKIKSLTEEFNKTHKEINNIETSIMITESEINKLKKSVNPYVEMFENNKIQIDNENKSLQSISDKYTYLKFAENIVSQDTLRKFIIADLIGLLNNKIKMYLTKFGAKFNVVFDSDMDYEFITDGGKCEYDNFSAGERARLMIAACFAFRDFMYIRNNLSSNILILDEFIDGAIDSMAIESILEILKNFSEIWKQNIFVISHRSYEMDKELFNSIIRIEKTNNIANIKYLDIKNISL